MLESFFEGFYIKCCMDVKHRLKEKLIWLQWLYNLKIIIRRNSFKNLNFLIPLDWLYIFITIIIFKIKILKRKNFS